MQTGGYAPFSNNLSPPVTLKMRSRSPKSNQHFSPSQSLAKICPFNKEIECRQEATTATPTGSALKAICPPPRMVGGHNYADDKVKQRLFSTIKGM